MKWYLYFCLPLLVLFLMGCQPDGTIITPLPTPISTDVPANTPTAVPTLPSTATLTPGPTATAAATIPPGWVRHDLGKVHLDLPAANNTIDLNDFDIEAGMGPLSASCQAEMEETEVAEAAILLTAVDLTATSGIPTIIMVAEEPLPPATSLQQVLERLQLCEDLKIMAREVVLVNGREVGRVVVKTDALGSPMKEIAYLFVQDNWMWSLIFVFSPKEEAGQTATWQQIAESFSVKP